MPTHDPPPSALPRTASAEDSTLASGSAAPPRGEGEVIADRFVVGRLAGRGGMGTVYRALDRMTGAPVALKVLRVGDERFHQEAQVLADLAHPAIVQYVAHGRTPRDEPFLAMEWLDGVDLTQALARGLGVGESLEVARRIAAGLAVAHARGIVHRDVKPSNIYLVGGDPSRAKLLDFGIVRLRASSPSSAGRPLTRTGMILGTVGYMSPEQATADRALDARTDVFALGCVLFECLTGEPAFSGAHVVAVLAKVLREEAPRVRHFRPELPQSLDHLVARMLRKDRSGRPADAGEVLRELDALGGIAGEAPDADGRPSEGLSGGEQRLVSVMLAVVPDEPDRVADIIRRHGGDQARLAGGDLLVTLSGRGSTSEQVVAAAACALELREAFPSARIALATGRVPTGAARPDGPVIDQAAALLAQSVSTCIRIDEVVAGLLGERFDLERDEKGCVLLGRKHGEELPRTLLGRPTPCVGRDRELGLLGATLRECVEESVAHAVLVTGPAGQGKSRLRHEFVKQAREYGEVAILTARADPVGAGSAFMMVRQLVRQAIDAREGDPASTQHAKLRARVADVCSDRDFARIADFLGELIEVPSTDRPSPQLRAARNDPQVMGEWLRRSFGEWLAAECRARPQLIVLEDLHWGDLPSVTYLGEALRALGGQPLMVLALARIEVHDAFPSLWAGAEKIEVPLGRLTPRACERLVRAALGDVVTDDAITRIVERADGNAFYLEELIRRVSEGGGDSLPPTVLALVQSRLERLEPEPRRIVRAASIFGGIFWNRAVDSLLGTAAGRRDLDEWLRILAEREVLTAAPESRFASSLQYVFRHGLLREGAYAMLTDADRTTGHRLAGEWLERAGEKDAVTMADHFEKGGEPKRAVPWLVKAAQTALGGGNLEAASALGNRGIACGAAAADRGLLLQVQGTAFFMRGNMPSLVDVSREAMELLEVGSTQWFQSAAGAFIGGMFLGDPNVTAPVLQAILGVQIQPEPSGPYGHAVSNACIGLAMIGQYEFARAFLQRAEAAERGTVDPDPLFVLHLRNSRGMLDYMGGDIGHSLASLAEARALGERTGEAFGQAQTHVCTVLALGQTAHFGRTEREYRALYAFCEPRGIGAVSDWGVTALAFVNLSANRPDETIAACATLLDRPDRFLATWSRALLAHGHLLLGDLAAAEREARRSLEEGAAFPATEGSARAALAQIDLRRGRPEGALVSAERGLQANAISPFPSNGSMLRLSRAEALRALGRDDDARAAIREARDHVLRVAATLDESPELRTSYLTKFEANARTLDLASVWLADG